MQAGQTERRFFLFLYNLRPFKNYKLFFKKREKVDLMGHRSNLNV